MKLILWMVLGVIGGPLLVLAIAYAFAFPWHVLGIVAAVIGLPFAYGFVIGALQVIDMKRSPSKRERDALADKQARDAFRPGP
jgi:ABC-type molybdate transport system permease subunit